MVSCWEGRLRLLRQRLLPLKRSLRRWLTCWRELRLTLSQALPDCLPSGLKQSGSYSFEFGNQKRLNYDLLM